MPTTITPPTPTAVQVQAQDRLLQRAASQIGVHEEGGNNRGQRVEEYQHITGGGPPDPWCADYVAWNFAKEGYTIDASMTNKGWPRTGYCPALLDWGERNHCLGTQAVRGAVFLLDDDGGGPRHTGFATGPAVNGYFPTIEGNTSNVNVADGDTVKRSSQRESVCWFLYWWLVPVFTSSAIPSTKLQVIVMDDATARVIDCHPTNENGYLRGDVKAVALALGADVDATKYPQVILRPAGSAQAA